MKTEEKGTGSRKLTEEAAKEFRKILLRWFRKHRRDMPWRRTKDPYKIWISEIMLQQTTVPTVVPYYERWMKTFPILDAVAAASLQKILKSWQGLGYYQRARNIHKTARIIKNDFLGRIPAAYEELIQLPGVGSYTAGAILSFAFGKSYPALEANSKRVLARVLCVEEPLNSSTEARLISFQTRLLPSRNAGAFHLALMDLGSLICLARNPLCLECPVRRFCLAYQRGKQELIPRKSGRKETRKVEAVVGIIRKCNKILIQQRPSKGLLAGLWEFPGGKRKKKESLEQALCRELREELGVEIKRATLLTKIRHSYTNFHVALHAYLCDLKPGKACDVLADACDARSSRASKRGSAEPLPGTLSSGHSSDFSRYSHGNPSARRGGTHRSGMLPGQYRWVTKTSIRHYPFPSGSARIVDFLIERWEKILP